MIAPAEFAGGSQERWAPSALCAQEGCHGDIGGCHSDVHPIRVVAENNNGHILGMIDTHKWLPWRCTPPYLNILFTTHLADPDGRGSPRESRHACLESSHVTEAPRPAGVDGSHSELVSLARLQLLAAGLHLHTLWMS